ncbi:DHHW family protein [Oceanirhabdus sp. W0125-5]|uniref:DHHW family protein n=1 Tax=Oceanirhabdus sp. W0125-5 TaxID=2999116 RepID=UPI0022F3286D|nr:DHHW family protein [Oceanirhabdus sp. W0125-5]WBW98214.1 DHHW family protein [Oceanirhabdus sp. W0125-5]
MSRTSNRFITFMCSIIMLLGLIFHIIIPDRSFSELENRNLSGFPKFNLKNLFSGKFTEDFEDYIQDQFPFRDFWVGIKSDTERASLKMDNNNVYFGEDGFLLEKFKKPGENLDKNINSINIFKDYLGDIPINFLLVPNSVKIYEDKLPKYAISYDQKKLMEYVNSMINNELNFINPMDYLLENKDEYLYFKTDHHWTMLGAYYGYTSFMESKGLEPINFEDFEIKTLTDSFYGTLYSKANNTHIAADEIQAFYHKTFEDIEISFNNKTESYDTYYFDDNLHKKDKYTVFLNGNNPQLKITTDNKNNKKIMVIKDSYAHCFIPFLSAHYEEIHVIDPRYYKVNLKEYVNENNINEVLFLYNVSNFTEDGALPWINFGLNKTVMEN